MKETKPTRTRWRRWRWAVLAVAGLLGLALVAYLVVLPHMVEQRMMAVLKELGFEKVKLRVGSVGFNRAHLHQIELGGAKPLIIRHANIHYRLAEAWYGRVDKITITGVILKAELDEDGLRLPQLEHLKLPEPTEPLEQLPFGEICIRSIDVRLETPQAKHDILFDLYLKKISSLSFSVNTATRDNRDSLTTRVTVTDDGWEITRGQLTMKNEVLALPWLGAPLRDVSLNLLFNGKSAGNKTSFVLLPNSRLTARVDRLQVEDGNASMVRIDGTIEQVPWVMGALAGKFAVLSRGGFNGELRAAEIGWRNGDMTLAARDVSAAVSVDEAGIMVALQPGAMLDCTPSAQLLARHGIKADSLKASLPQLAEPTVLRLPTSGSWSLEIPDAKLRVTADGLKNKEAKVSFASLEANLRVRVAVRADALDAILLSGAGLATGEITQAESGPLKVAPTDWKIAPMDARSLLSWRPNLGLALAGHVTTPALMVTHDELQLNATPLRASFSRDANGLSLDILEPTRVRLARGDGLVFPGDARAEALSVAIQKIWQPIQLRLPVGADEWAITAPDIQVVADIASVDLNEPGVRMDSLKAPARLSVTVNAKQATIAMLNPSTIRVDGIRINEEAGAAKISAKDWRILPRNEKLQPVIDFDREKSVLRFSGRLEGKGVVAGRDGVGLTAEKLGLAATGQRDANGVLTGKLDFSVNGGTLDLNASAVRLDGFEGAGQWGLGKTPAKTGWFKIGSTRLGENQLAEIRGTMTPRDGGVDFSANTELVKGLKAKARGHAGPDSTRISVTIPPATITDPKELGFRFPVLKNFEISGTVGLEAALDINANGMVPRVKLLMRDVSVASETMAAIVEGISGMLVLNGLEPPTTPGPQQLTVRGVRSGRLELVNGVTVFRLDVSGIFIEEESWSLAQDPAGKFRARNIRLAAGQPMRADIEVEQLDLGIWLGLLTDGQVIASGKLSGRVPVTLTDGESKLPVRVGDGAFLKTDGPGKLQFKSAKWAGDWLESAYPRFRTDPILKGLRNGVVEALQDFSYSTIEFRYDEKADRMRVAVRGEGKTNQGRVVKFDPTINVEPVASWLNASYNELVLLAHLENMVNRDLDDLFGE